MLKYSLNRLMLQNRGFWIKALNENIIAWPSDKTILIPKAAGNLLKNSSYSCQILISARKMSIKSQIRQNYHEESENGVNKQINLELYASYVYMAMSSHFDRDDVALENISDYFKKFSDEERKHAMKFIKFQNLRGGTVILQNIKAPAKSNWKNALEALENALELEKEINEALLDLHKIASKHEDAQMTDFLEKEYLSFQVEDIKELGEHVTNLKRTGPGLGEYVFDKKFRFRSTAANLDKELKLCGATETKF